MPDFRGYFDADYVGAWDLDGKDCIVTIDKVTGGEVSGEAGRKSRKILLHFRGKQKPMVCNKTNAKTLATLYGPNTDKWIGKSCILFPTITLMGGETKDCIRIRPHAPKGKDAPAASSQAQPTVEREPGGDDEQ